MSDFQHQAIRLTAQQQPLTWLESLRNKATDDWLAQPWPTRKTEHWKYTPMQGLQKTLLHVWGAAANQTLDKALQNELIPLDAIRLVFVNGMFDAKHSSRLPETVVRFSQANAE
jgi:Fe-S cluster assembly protein SufD